MIEIELFLIARRINITFIFKKYQNSFKTKVPMPPSELLVMPPFDFLVKPEHQRLLELFPSFFSSFFLQCNQALTGNP